MLSILLALCHFCEVQASMARVRRGDETGCLKPALTANPNTGDNKVLVHESVTLLGAEERKHIIEARLA